MTHPQTAPLKLLLHLFLTSIATHLKKSVSCSVMSNPLRLHGISQARILEWVAIPFSKGSSLPRNQTQVGLLHYRQILNWLTHQGSPTWSFRWTNFPTLLLWLQVVSSYLVGKRESSAQWELWPTEPGTQGVMSLMVTFQRVNSSVLEKHIPGSDVGRLRF